jgi:DNA-directed RNA polymerase subunit F
MISKSQNTPPAALQERDVQEEDKWTIERIVDELFLNLVNITEIVTIEENGRSIPVRKYYRQARELMKWIPIARPSPEFIINICDLTPKVRKEIESILTYRKTMQYVITQAVGRIFENLDFEYYNLSVARNLRVRFEP